MANSVDPDQTPRSVSTLFAQAYLSENIGWTRFANRKDPDRLAKPQNPIKVLVIYRYILQWKIFCKRTAEVWLDHANA